MKKVILLIKDLYGGGAERAISRLSYILSDECELYMVLFNTEKIQYKFKGELIDLNVPIRNTVFGKIFSMFERIVKLRNIKKKLQIDTTISYLENANIVNLLTFTEEKKIISIRNYKSKEVESSIYQKILSVVISKLYKKADVIVPVSKMIKEDMIHKYNLPESKLKVIYNAYDINEIEKLSKQNISEKYNNVFKDKIIFSTVGRISYQKGFWNIIKSINLIKDKIPNILLLIIGDNIDEKLYKNMVNMVNKHGLENNIIFLGRKNNPFKYLKYSRGYIMSSLFEGFPNALVEAMALGIPVISTDCKSGPREILFENYIINKKINKIEMGDYGIIIPEFEKEVDFDMENIAWQHKELAKAIEILSNNDFIYEKYSEVGLKRSKDFTYQDCKKKYLQII